VCRPRLDETAIALISRRRNGEVNQPGEPTSAADAEGVHFSKGPSSSLALNDSIEPLDTLERFFASRFPANP